jgi:hypothetical protein
MEKVRVIRVLEYVGTRRFVESSLEERGVKGTKLFGGDCFIREAFLGEFPEVVEEEKEVITRDEVSEKQAIFMTRFGWEFPGDFSLATKYEHISGKVLAHEGDETWTRDLKVAGE